MHVDGLLWPEFLNTSHWLCKTLGLLMNYWLITLMVSWELQERIEFGWSSEEGALSGLESIKTGDLGLRP